MSKVTTLEERVLAFVARESSANADKMFLSTKLSGDLGIEGDDAVELMARFAEQFNVDMSAYRHSDYFGAECSFVPLAVIWPPWWKARRQRRVVAIIDLVRAARYGYWPAPGEPDAEP